MDEIFESPFMTWLMSFGKNLLIGILILVVGFWLSRKLANLLMKIFAKRGVELSVQLFLKNIIDVLLKIMVIITAAQVVGIQMTSFIALLGAAGVAIGMSLKGTLSNFAGGIIIMFNKPFKIGDFIEYSGYSGTVREIKLFNTVLVTSDLKTVIVPNGAISDSTIINYSTEDKRRVDFKFGIGYDDDYEKAKNIILDIAKKNAKILKSPEPFIAMSEMGDSSINITFRVWVNNSDYWPVYFSTLEEVKKAFDSNGISIPYPQRDVHLYNHTIES